MPGQGRCTYLLLGATGRQGVATPPVLNQQTSSAGKGPQHPTVPSHIAFQNRASGSRFLKPTGNFRTSLPPNHVGKGFSKRMSCF